MTQDVRPDSVPPRFKAQVTWREMGLTETEYDHLYDYAAYNRYPTGSSKNQRRIIRRKCIEHFRAENGVLYYSAVGTSKAVSYPLREWVIVIRTEKERTKIFESCHSSPHGMYKRLMILIGLCRGGN